MRVEALVDHEEDHGHSSDPQDHHVTSGQQGETGQDGGRVDTWQATVHEGDAAGEEAEADKHRQDVAHAQDVVH